jgi:hypothetical protein
VPVRPASGHRAAGKQAAFERRDVDLVTKPGWFLALSRMGEGSEIGSAKVMGMLELDGDNIIAWRD